MFRIHTRHNREWSKQIKTATITHLWVIVAYLKARFLSRAFSFVHLLFYSLTTTGAFLSLILLSAIKQIGVITVKYTKNTLREINYSYDCEHHVTDSDLTMANRYVERIESTRSKTQPKTGDLLLLTDKYGKYYDHAHLEFDTLKDTGVISYCENPYTPFVNMSSDGISCSTSGGAWGHIPVSKLKYVGSQEKAFCDFGHNGGCANGAVTFYANVSVWSYDCNEQPHSTKTHALYYIHRHPNNHNDYLYSADGQAWRDDASLQAWLRTHRAECFKGNSPGQMIVWAYKNKPVSVSPAKYDKMDLPEDAFMINGTMYRCKRKYNDKLHMFTTYHVWYWNEPGDFFEIASRQNELRKAYEIHDKHIRVNEFAHRELEQNKVKPIDLSVCFGIK